MFLKNKSITLSLILFILPLVLLVFTIVFSYNYFLSYKTIKKGLQHEAYALAHSAVNETDIILTSVKKVGETISSFIENGNDSKEVLEQILFSAVANNKEIISATIAFEPYNLDSEKKYYSPTVTRSKENLELQYLGNDKYQYHLMDWYQISKIKNSSIWSEPYYDIHNPGNIMATFSTPIYDKNDSVRGIVRLGIDLSWLHDMISNMEMIYDGYAFLISGHGTFITHPLSEIIINDTIFGLASERKDKNLRIIGQNMTRGKEGFTRFISLLTGENEWMVYTPLNTNSWSLAVIFPDEALHDDIRVLTYKVIFIALVGLILISIAIILIARSITKPLIKLVSTSKEISSGNFEFELDHSESKDEVSLLSNSFIAMRDSLKEYIKQLKETTAAKEHIEGELRIAHDIQMSIIPQIFPAFPNREEFDLYAIIEPAKEVGGDLYDFFFIDEDNICIIIGDVSGKGVPASLFMAVTNTMIKAVAAEFNDPEKIIAKVNRQLSHGNEACMFVTLFCSIFNIRTGELRYANGGHNPPILISKNKVGYIDVVPAISLGLNEDASFQQQTLQLEKGDAIFLYTDGVTEAFNEDEEQFSEERLLETIKKIGSSSPITVCSEILVDIKSFAGNKPQSDDITILMLEYKK